MAASTPPLLGLHAYEAAARHLSFAKAAAELHLSPSAVSQRVRGLEAHLGTQLFERLPRGLRLTSVGEAYLPAVRDIFEELSAATTGLFGNAGKVQLTIRVQVSYAATWLAPRLQQFCALMPHVEVRLLSAIWADALPPSEIDLDIRQGNGSWPGFIATKLHDDNAVAICGPRQQAQHGEAFDLKSLAQREYIHTLGFEDVWQRFFASDSSFPGSPPRAVSVDTSVNAVELVAASHYWAIVPERFTRSALREGRVSLAHPQTVSMRQAHYCLRPEDARPPRREVSAFIEWLQAQDLIDSPSTI
ncbi:MAG: LysR substrate-binding domain-containing protein [Ornithinimicrobium sp.]